MSEGSPCWYRYVVGLSVGTLVSCSGPAPATVNHGGLDLSRATVIDLSHAYDDDSLFWPTSPTRFELTSLEYGVSEGGYFYSANTFCTPEHGGTHIDAPIHFAEHGWTLGGGAGRAADCSRGGDRCQRGRSSKCRLPTNSGRCSAVGARARRDTGRLDRVASNRLESPLARCDGLSR